MIVVGYGRFGQTVAQMLMAKRIPVTIIDSMLYIAIYAIGALGLFSSISLWLGLPMAVWIAAYVALLWYFVPRARSRSLANAEWRSATTGRCGPGSGGSATTR